MAVMKWWLLLFIVLPFTVLAIPGSPDKQAYCVSLAGKGDCDFYDDCIEKWTQTCGVSGYALGYGGKYCRKFGDNLQMFNEAVSRKSNNSYNDLLSIKRPLNFTIVHLAMCLL